MKRCAALVLAALIGPAGAETMNDMKMAPAASAAPGAAADVPYVGGVAPVMDQDIYLHGVVDELEDRWDGRGHGLRFVGNAIAGGDLDKLLLRTEGTLGRDGRLDDGDHEVLIDRAVSTYGDLLGGVRIDADSFTSRSWAAIGYRGLLPYAIDTSLTGYASDGGHLAAKLEVSTDLAITNRLILQPEAEFNVYSRADAGRGVRSGLSDIDAGLRLRYEITRKLAPYVGVVFRGGAGAPGATLLALGVRGWF